MSGVDSIRFERHLNALHAAAILQCAALKPVDLRTNQEGFRVNFEACQKRYYDTIDRLNERLY